MSISFNNLIRRRMAILNDNGNTSIFCITKNRNGNILSYGYNTYNIDDKFSSQHAEVDAFKKLYKNLSRKRNSKKGRHSKKRCNVNVYIYRINKSGTKIMSADPCAECVKFMSKQQKLFNVKKIFCSTNDGNLKIVSI